MGRMVMPAYFDGVLHCCTRHCTALQQQALAVLKALLELQHAGGSRLCCCSCRLAAEQHTVMMRRHCSRRIFSQAQQRGNGAAAAAQQLAALRHAGVDVVGQQRKRGAVAALKRLQPQHLSLRSGENILQLARHTQHAHAGKSCTPSPPLP